MEYYAGIDVAMGRSALCVIDETGSIVFERSIETEPDVIAETRSPYAGTLRRVGHETGSLAPWLHKQMRARGLLVVCMEAAHTRSALSAMRNKTDRNDARALAQILRTGWFRAVHIKSDESYRMRLLLTARRNMKRKFLDIENAIRHSLKAFGIRLGKVSRGRFEAKVRAALADDMVLTGMVEGLLKGACRIVDGVLRPAQALGEDRGARSGVPALPGRARRGARYGAELSRLGR